MGNQVARRQKCQAKWPVQGRLEAGGEAEFDALPRLQASEQLREHGERSGRAHYGDAFIPDQLRGELVRQSVRRTVAARKFDPNWAVGQIDVRQLLRFAGL